MAGPLDSRFAPQVEKALAEGDFGEEQEDGTFFKTLAPITHTPNRAKGEVEEAASVERIRPKTRAERERLPQELTNRLIKYYIDNLNNPTFINPIRDGIPQCVAHPFKSGVSPGCYKGCITGVLPRSQDQTLGDVMVWVRNLIAFNYRVWISKNPALKGVLSDIL